MAEYIDKASALRPFVIDKNGHRIRETDIDNRLVDISIRQVKQILREIPAADVAPVVHGVWIEEEKEIEFYGCIDKQTFYKCSLCGRYEEKQEPYCNCGAKMDVLVCSEIECEPPYGDKSDCELYKNGYCGAKMDRERRSE